MNSEAQEDSNDYRNECDSDINDAVCEKINSCKKKCDSVTLCLDNRCQEQRCSYIRDCYHDCDSKLIESVDNYNDNDLSGNLRSKINELKNEKTKLDEGKIRGKRLSGNTETISSNSNDNNGYSHSYGYRSGDMVKTINNNNLRKGFDYNEDYYEDSNNDNNFEEYGNIVNDYPFKFNTASFLSYPTKGNKPYNSKPKVTVVNNNNNNYNGYNGRSHHKLKLNYNNNRMGFGRSFTINNNNNYNGRSRHRNNPAVLSRIITTNNNNNYGNSRGRVFNNNNNYQSTNHRGRTVTITTTTNNGKKSRSITVTDNRPRYNNKQYKLKNHHYHGYPLSSGIYNNNGVKGKKQKKSRKVKKSKGRKKTNNRRRLTLSKFIDDYDVNDSGSYNDDKDDFNNNNQ